MSDNDTPEKANSDPHNGDHGEESDEERLIEILSSSPRLPRRPVADDESRTSAANARATVFTLQNTAGGPMTFQITGAWPFKSRPIRAWNIDFGTLNVQMNDLGRYLASYHQDEDDAGRARWRQTAQEIGTHLYNGLLNSDAVLTRQLTSARHRATAPESLLLAFVGPRDYLSVPYELMHDGQVPLAVIHPIYRQITGVISRHKQPLRVFVRQLQQAGDPLRVLLISSGAAHLGADQEVADLQAVLRQVADRDDLRIEIEHLRPRNLETLKHRLSHCACHLVHYVGQVYHDKNNPDQSGLLFSAAGEDHLGQWVLPLHELAQLVQNSAIQLFYVSACVGSQVWDEYMLRDQDYLDLFALLANAGIPYVLGFRWYVTEYNRQRFAALFYESLLRKVPFLPEQAVWYARRAIFDHDQQDETWASPLLIAQNPYL